MLLWGARRGIFEVATIRLNRKAGREAGLRPASLPPPSPARLRSYVYDSHKTCLVCSSGVAVLLYQ